MKINDLIEDIENAGFSSISYVEHEWEAEDKILTIRFEYEGDFVFEDLLQLSEIVHSTNITLSTEAELVARIVM